MKRILAFSFFPAMSPPKSGGELRLYNIYLELSRRFEVVLLSSYHVGQEEQRIWHSETFLERRLPKGEAFLDAWARLSAVSGSGDLSGPCVAAEGAGASAFHLAYLEEYPDADILIHDSPFTVGYDTFIGFDQKPRVYNSYNCETDLYRMIHPDERAAPIHALVAESEAKLLSAADLIAYCGVKDLESFGKVGPLPEAVFVPNGATAQNIPERKPRKGPVEDVVFIGSGHFPNVEAAHLIVNKIAPAAPQVRFHIIGNCLEEGIYPVNVIRHGVITDAQKNEVMLRADMALNPMVSGSGSNLKVFDFFQNGLPVLSTAFGVRGVEGKDGEHYIEADIDRFAEVLVSRRDRRALEKIGAAGRKLVGDLYSWRSIANRFGDRLEGLDSRHDGPVGSRCVLGLNDYDPFATLGGGGTRIRSLYSAALEWSPVVFICLTDETGLTMRSAEGEAGRTGVAVLAVPKTATHRAREREINGRFHISAADIVSYEQARQNPFLIAAYAVLRATARIVVTEHPYMVGLPTTFGDRFVYSSHNCETDLKQGLMQWHPDREGLIEAVVEAETMAVEMAAAVVAVSEEDALALVRGRNQAPPILVVRNGAACPVKPSVGQHARAKAQVGAASAVFVGSAHMPNVDAANFIVADVAPNCPNVTFHIIGGVCEALPSPLPANVVAWGRLHDGEKTAVMEAASIAINPMFSGSGSNVKLADYLAHGLPVVSTEFGARGYPVEVTRDISIATKDTFAASVANLVNDKARRSKTARTERVGIFRAHCAMDTLAQRFVTLLRDLETPRNRVLFVTYRYTWPTLGGAEGMLASFLTGLCETGNFNVDVAATDVSAIGNDDRFGSSYKPVTREGALVDVPNLRFVRFAVDEGETILRKAEIGDAWDVQPVFERELFEQLRPNLAHSGLAWGWDYPDLEGRAAGINTRRAMRSAGLYLAQPGTVRLEGALLGDGAVRIELSNGTVAAHEAASGPFDFSFTAPAGPVGLTFSLDQPVAAEARPLGAVIKSVKLDGRELDLSSPTLMSVAHLPAEEAFAMMAQAASRTRDRAGVELTAIRGPHSSELEAFLDREVGNYDLVITHNSVFRPAVAAIEAARKRGVKSILIPHLHLDDDFYHFKDVVGSSQQATVVLAAPKAACRFLAGNGEGNVGYLPAGIDMGEAYTADDVAAFRQVHKRRGPFVLVLGRKAGAKNYQLIIDAVAEVAEDYDLHAVLIGPDDDGVIIDTTHAAYLGRQPRSIVRGALQSCVAVVNMSTSESFGIVLLEAWLAGRPVIANADCAAFHDLAVDGHNALLVSPDGLAAAVARLATDEALAQALVARGRVTARAYDWRNLRAEFAEFCSGLIEEGDRSLPISFGVDGIGA